MLRSATRLLSSKDHDNYVDVTNLHPFLECSGCKLVHLVQSFPAYSAIYQERTFLSGNKKLIDELFKDLCVGLPTATAHSP